MPDPELEFRGLSIYDHQGVHLDVVRGFLMPPAVRGQDIIVPARVGRDSGNRIADVLTIILEGWVGGEDPEDWRVNTDALIAVLDESGQDPGVLTARSPYMGLGMGLVATINARVKNYIEGPIRAWGVQTWSIELESVDPYWVITTEGS